MASLALAHTCECVTDLRHVIRIQRLRIRRVLPLKLMSERTDPRLSSNEVCHLESEVA